MEARTDHCRKGAQRGWHAVRFCRAMSTEQWEINASVRTAEVQQLKNGRKSARIRTECENPVESPLLCGEFCGTGELEKYKDADETTKRLRGKMRRSRDCVDVDIACTCLVGFRVLDFPLASHHL